MPFTRYVVKWADTAANDLEGIIDYIAKDSIPNATHILKKIRELQSPPWRIIYRLSGDSVYLLAIFDSRRNFEDLLLERFVR